MNLDDIVYVSLLFFSIGFGYIYRQIYDIQFKKYIGTLIGLLIITIVSGFHILHPIITIIINALIILYVDKRICHIISFIFSFSYLLFFRTTIYFGIPYPPSHTNLIQMILTLKLVGLAFEVNSSNKKPSKLDNRNEFDNDDDHGDNFIDVPNFCDIFHYSLNYIGVLTGPYYRYRTFNDYFKYPIYKDIGTTEATIKKIKFVPLYAGLYLIASYFWPFSYALTQEIFVERSWIYRQWFVWPSFFIFRMRIYIGIVLSECVCTMAGLGAYPAYTEPKPGAGPTKNYQKMIKSNENNVVEYNFKTILNVNPYGADFCTTYREGMKHWNICVQYWLAVNIYKRCPYKKIRVFVTLLVSSFWHGVYSGYYFCIGTVPLVLIVEDVYIKLYKNNKIYEWIHWILKMHFFSYQSIAFLLLDIDKVLHYYNSIYHATAIFGLVLYGAGLHLLKLKKTQEKKYKNSIKISE